MKARTCIVCGKRAGSKEHVFPAALGGRRVNKGIYCGPHNNAYGPLAGVLSSQLKAVNAWLGVRGDHADEPHAVEVTDVASGRPYRMSTTRSEMEPELVSETRAPGGGKQVTMAFSSERQLEDWKKAQREAGFNVAVGERSVQQRFLGQAHVHMQLGGAEGLRAIGYVAQTFLAHRFPAVARSPALEAFVQGTLDPDKWAEGAWWAAEPDPAALPPQPFEFGHRLIVGTDPETGSAYARVSLFSTLHFAVLFGAIECAEPRTVVIDIDPLADAPPHDIAEQRFDRALAPVIRPEDLTAQLSNTIRSGRGQEAFGRLMARIQERDLYRAADAMLAELEAAPPQQGLVEREALLARVLEPQSQRILNLMRKVAEELRDRALPPQLASVLDQAVALDPESPNGLTPLAFAHLQLAKAAVLGEMLQEHDAGRLDRERMAMLIGGGLGLAAVGRAILEPLLGVLERAAR